MRSSLIEARPDLHTQGDHKQPVSRSHRPPATPATPAKKEQRMQLTPAEGWLPMLLLAIAVYSVVYSVTAAITISHTSVLWMTTALGLACGLLISKSRYFPQAVLHIAACILGYWMALLLTCLAYRVSLLAMLSNLHAVLTNSFSLTGSPGSEMVFLFYLAFLCFFLGYFGSWLIYRAHLPWLVALVYVSIMIVNLNYIAKQDLTYLVVILVAALIPLIARVQLAGQLAQWKNEGLYTDQVWLHNLTSRFLRIVALFALLILPLSWLLPMVNQPSAGVTMWDKLDNAWTNLSHGNLSLSNPHGLFDPYESSGNFFGDQLTITGNVNLPNGPVLTYTSSSSAAGQYLEGYSFDSFDGHSWTSQVESYPQPYSADDALPQSGPQPDSNTLLSTSVTILQPPGGTKHFIFAPAQPYRFTTPVTIYTDPTGNIITAWTQTAPLQANERYEVFSNNSSATPAKLARIALPDDNPDTWVNDPSYKELEQYYLQVPKDLSPTVLATAQKWTSGLHHTYDVVAALQRQLSNQAVFTYSVTNPPVPANTDAVTWLLQTHRGYCTYYATAMVMMARLLGIPARIVNGFSEGHYDAQQKAWIVDGSDAHSWVQVYFPNQGWINFDPTPGFSINDAGAPVTSKINPTREPTPKITPSTPQKHQTPVVRPTPTAPRSGITSTTPGSTDTANKMNLFMSISLLILLGSCVILGFAILRYLRTGQASRTAIASLYSRLCRIAGLVGSPPASWQTPYEYTSALSQRFPQVSTTLQRIADLFVRERWASPHQAPDLREQQELERLWPTVRNTLLRSPFSKGR